MKYAREIERARRILSERGTWVISITKSDKYLDGYVAQMFFQLSLKLKEMQILRRVRKFVTPKFVRDDFEERDWAGRLRPYKTRAIWTVQDSASMGHLFKFLEDHPLTDGPNKRKFEIFRDAYPDYDYRMPGYEEKLRRARTKMKKVK